MFYAWYFCYCVMFIKVLAGWKKCFMKLVETRKHLVFFVKQNKLICLCKWKDVKALAKNIDYNKS